MTGLTVATARVSDVYALFRDSIEHPDKSRGERSSGGSSSASVVTGHYLRLQVVGLVDLEAI